MIKAKTILKDKFWIVEDETSRLGTISVSDDKFVFSSSDETLFFNTERQLKKKFKDLVWIDVEQKEEQKDFSVHGFPCSSQPHNSMYDIKNKLPLYTKSDKSKSIYCAGYYIIRFDKGWVKSFCPKLITVERYATKGPFKTELEMKQELSRANK